MAEWQQVERYELASAPSYHFRLNRRQLFKVFGGGLVVLLVSEDAAAQESGAQRRPGPGESYPAQIGAWLHIAEDGLVTAYTGKAEVGQDIRTSLTQVIADELGSGADSIRLVMADTDLTPFDTGTFGSRTTPVMAAQLRKVAAAARHFLIELAAEQLKADRAGLVASEGKITDPETGRSLTFGHLTQGQKIARAIGEDVATKPAGQWKIAGQAIPKVGGRSAVTGRHKFASDVKRPGMLHGKILRPSAFGAALVSLSTSQAESIDNVVVVRDGDFVGVAAPNEQLAARAFGAIESEWKILAQPSSSDLFDFLRKNPVATQGGESRSRHVTGSIEDGLAAADRTAQQTYTVAYIAHAPLEPRAAVAEWTDGRLTVWTGTQRPFGVRSELAQAFRLPEQRVRVIVPDTGSAYGGKHTGEAAIEAARLAQGAGKPVKLVWTREEEFTWAYFRPAGVIDVNSGVRHDGTITAWEFHNYNSGTAAIRPLYDIPNQRVEFHATKSPLRQGSYRGLAATANHFARETHIDELARILKMDPLEFRYRNLKDARLRAVLAAAAERFGWGKTSASPNKGVGLAGGFEKGSYVASCVEVSVEPPGRVRVVRVATAFECGAVVNPDHLKNQIEGSVIMGLGGALFEAIEFKDGKILNARFSSYRVPRFSDVPALETVLVDRKDLPSAGAGETPIVAIAPALGNAIFDATGIRLRSLPLTLVSPPRPRTA